MSMKLKAILNCADNTQFVTEPRDDIHDKSVIIFQGAMFVYQYQVHGEQALFYQEQPEANHLRLRDEEATRL